MSLQPDISSDMPQITSSDTQIVVTNLMHSLTEHYVFPEVAARICEAIRHNNGAGVFATVQTPEALCRMLTEQMQAISKDKHLVLLWRPENLNQTVTTEVDEAAREEEHRREAFYRNGGFRNVERLPGNIGYLDIRSFVLPTCAGETAVAAMAFLAHTEALILDVRDNLGGDGNMVNMLTTYFFDGKVQVGGVYRRKQNQTSEFWTMPCLALEQIITTAERHSRQAVAEAQAALADMSLADFTG